MIYGFVLKERGLKIKFRETIFPEHNDYSVFEFQKKSLENYCNSFLNFFEYDDHHYLENYVYARIIFIFLENLLGV